MVAAQRPATRLTIGLSLTVWRAWKRELDSQTPIACIHAHDETTAMEAERRLKIACRLGGRLPVHVLIPEAVPHLTSQEV